MGPRELRRILTQPGARRNKGCGLCRGLVWPGLHRGCRRGRWLQRAVRVTGRGWNAAGVERRARADADRKPCRAGDMV